MMRNFRTALLIFAWAGTIPLTAAKNCPSRLLSHLHPLGGSPFSWALELRGFDHLVEGENFVYYGLGGMLRFEPGENLSLDLEAVYRPKRYGDCAPAKGLSPFQLKTLSLNLYLEGPDVEIRAGRQEVLLGSGLVLNDFFDAVSLEAGLSGLTLRAGAGVLALQAAKEALYCQKCFFYEFRSSWKGFCRSNYGDHGMAYFDLTGSLGKNRRAGLLYLRTWAPPSGFSSHTLSLHGNLRLPGRVNLFTEAAIQKLDEVPGWAHGWFLEAVRNFNFRGLGTLTLRAAGLFGSADGTSLFTPLYGNLFMGDRQHYSVRQGRILGFRVRFLPEFLKSISLETAYFFNPARGFGDPLTDEFDLGLDIRLFKSENLRIFTVWSRSMTPVGRIGQLRMETRVNF
jgi:hypothetical protein